MVVMVGDSKSGWSEDGLGTGILCTKKGDLGFDDVG